MDGAADCGLKVCIGISPINIFCSHVGMMSCAAGAAVSTRKLSFRSPFLVFTLVLVSVSSSVSLPIFLPVPVATLAPTPVPLPAVAAASFAAVACSVASAAAPAAGPSVARMRPGRK